MQLTRFRSRLAPLAAVAACVALLAACGGGGKSSSSSSTGASSASSGASSAASSVATTVSVPAGAVAQVDKTTITKAQFDQVYESAVAQQKLDQQIDAPKPGSKDEMTLKQQVLEYLVRRAVLEQEAQKAGLKADAKAVDDTLSQLKTSCCQGDAAKFQKYLAERKLDEAFMRGQAEFNVLLDLLYKRVTKDVAVTDADIQKQYDTDKATKYTTAAKRTVQYALFGKRDFGGKEDPKEKAKAAAFIAQLDKGGDFEKLAKKLSEDPSAKQPGAKPEIDVPKKDDGGLDAAFRKAALALKIGDYTKEPVFSKSFGYFVIKAIKDVPETVQPLSAVKATIKSELLQKKQQEAADSWLKDTSKRYQSLIAVATGYTFPPDSQFAPPGLAVTATGPSSTDATTGTDTTASTAGTDTGASSAGTEASTAGGDTAASTTAGTDTAASTAATTG